MSEALLSWHEFIQQREGQKRMIQGARLAIASELAVLEEAQTAYTQGLLRKLDDFDEACAGVQRDSQVFQIVTTVQALSEKVAHLERAKRILTLTIRIERSK